MRRIINTPKRGLGDRALEAIDDFAKAEGITFWQGLNRASAAGLGAKASSAVAEFVAMIAALQVLVEANRPPATIAAAVLEQSGLLDELRDSHDPQDEVRIENLRS
jgi:Superfamily I DNA and RNA helicases